jgi:hypothetical protein
MRQAAWPCVTNGTPLLKRLWFGFGGVLFGMPLPTFLQHEKEISKSISILLLSLFALPFCRIVHASIDALSLAF